MSALTLCAILAFSRTTSAQETADPKVRPPSRSNTALAERLVLGDAAPPIQATSWLNGSPLDLSKSVDQRIVVLVFFATWSEPCREALAALRSVQRRYAKEDVLIVGLTDEKAETVRPYLHEFDSPLGFRIALDRGRETTAAYCEAAGVAFVPYAFVVGPDGKIAWHGHPRQPELVRVLHQLRDGTYSLARARRSVRQTRSAEQLEGMFRDAYAHQAWHAALLALNALLETNAPKPRLLRYKLSILLAELGRVEESRKLVERAVRDYSDQPRMLNGLAWEIVSDPRAYMKAPGAGLSLARAAYAASKGEDAAIADTYARALYIIGRLTLAIEVQRRAVSLSSDEQKAAHTRTLAFYERCRALHDEIDARPILPTPPSTGSSDRPPP